MLLIDTLLVLGKKRLDQPEATYGMGFDKKDTTASKIAKTEDMVWRSFPEIAFYLQLFYKI